MTTLLSKAIKRIEKLPQEMRDEIAEQLLEDFQSELHWQETLPKPQLKLDKLAFKALRESSAGKTKKMGFDKKIALIKFKDETKCLPSDIFPFS